MRIVKVTTGDPVVLLNEAGEIVAVVTPSDVTDGGLLARTFDIEGMAEFGNFKTTSIGVSMQSVRVMSDDPTGPNVGEVKAALVEAGLLPEEA